jgi:hypothetical protein
MFLKASKICSRVTVGMVGVGLLRQYLAWLRVYPMGVYFGYAAGE